METLDSSSETSPSKTFQVNISVLYGASSGHEKKNRYYKNSKGLDDEKKSVSGPEEDDDAHDMEADDDSSAAMEAFLKAQMGLSASYENVDDKKDDDYGTQPDPEPQEQLGDTESSSSSSSNLTPLHHRHRLDDDPHETTSSSSRLNPSPTTLAYHATLLPSSADGRTTIEETRAARGSSGTAIAPSAPPPPPPSPLLYNPFTNYSPGRPRQRPLMAFSSAMSMFSYRNGSNNINEKKNNNDQGSQEDWGDHFPSYRQLLGSEEDFERYAQHIRAELRQAELIELAMAAEQAAEAGEERFTAPPLTYALDDADLSPSSPSSPLTGGKISSKPDSLLKRRRSFSEGTRRRVPPNTYSHQNLSSASHHNKLHMLALRDVKDVFPSFTQFHAHLRTHLARNKIPEKVLVFHEVESNGFFFSPGSHLSGGAAAVAASHASSPSRLSFRKSQHLDFLDGLKLYHQWVGNSMAKLKEEKESASIVGDLIASSRASPSIALGQRKRPVLEVPPGLEKAALDEFPLPLLEDEGVKLNAIDEDSGPIPTGSLLWKGGMQTVDTVPTEKGADRKTLLREYISPISLFDEEDESDGESVHQRLDWDKGRRSKGAVTPTRKYRRHASTGTDFHTPARLRDIRGRRHESVDLSLVAPDLLLPTNSVLETPPSNIEIPSDDDLPIREEPPVMDVKAALSAADSKESSYAFREYLRRESKDSFEVDVVRDRSQSSDKKNEEDGTLLVDKELESTIKVAVANLLVQDLQSISHPHEQRMDSKLMIEPSKDSKIPPDSAVARTEWSTHADRCEPTVSAEDPNDFDGASRPGELMVFANQALRQDELVGPPLRFAEENFENKAFPHLSPQVNDIVESTTDQQNRAMDVFRPRQHLSMRWHNDDCVCLTISPASTGTESNDKSASPRMLQRKEAIRRSASTGALQESVQVESNDPPANTDPTPAIDFRFAAMKIFSQLSTGGNDSHTQRRRLYFRSQENDDFLTNYTYRCKATNQEEFETLCTDEPCQNNQMPCGEGTPDACCVSLLGDSARSFVPFRSPKHFISLNRSDSSSKLEPETWFDRATERFDSLLELLAGSTRRQARRLKVGFQAPSLKMNLGVQPESPTAESFGMDVIDEKKAFEENLETYASSRANTRHKRHFSTPEPPSSEESHAPNSQSQSRLTPTTSTKGEDPPIVTKLTPSSSHEKATLFDVQDSPVQSFEQPRRNVI